MQRLRWYGPSVVLLLTALVVLLAGPGMVRRIVWAGTDAKISLVKEGLEGNNTLAELSKSFRQVATVVEPSVVHIQVAARGKPKNAGGPNRMEEEMLRRFFGPRGMPVPPGDEEGDEEAPPAPRGKPDSRRGGEDLEKYNAPRVYGNGSGWVFDNAGHIITNNHVIDGADIITVRFHDKSERTAKIVGVDPKTDIAVLKVEGGDLHPATIAKDATEQGDIVFAFGSPFRFDFSMSQGIVSAKGRQLYIVQDGQGYENFIQTDAAINPGNSGGPLTNIYGHVVGMNTAIASRTGAYNGLGFAIPIDMVTDVVNQIIKSGRVVRGYLGVFIQTLDPKMAPTFDYNGKGVLVPEAPIEGGPAAKAGVQRGDIIVKVEGKPVATDQELRGFVAGIPPGKTIKLEVVRKGKPVTIDVTVAEQPKDMASVTPAPENDASAKAEDKAQQQLRRLGIEGVATMSDEVATQSRLKFSPGVLVKAVRPDSAAAAAGLRPGSIITEVKDAPVKSVEELTAQLDKFDLAKGVRLSVREGNQQRYVLLELQAK